MAGSLWPQAFTATLSGTVVDSTSAVVAGARVRVVNIETSQVAVVESDGTGRFVAASLQPGGYSLTVQAPGFKMLERTGIVLRVAQSMELELRLEVGQVTESVEVTAQPPLIESGTSTVGQVIDNRTILNLPANQRNAFGFVFLAPGVTGNVGFFYINVNIRINGGRPGSNAILVDGVLAAIPLTNPIQGIAVNPSVDAVAEFKVQSSNYSAEHGRTGGGVINLVYKSGTNEFHGSAFEFLRNSVMDANNFFANQRGQELASFKRNQFGTALGGPVVLPKLYNGRDRTFFFSYEGLRERQATDFLSTVPTASQKAGDFSQTRTGGGAPIVIYDPLTTVPSGSSFTRQPFAGDRIPQARFDKVAANVLKYFPAPTGPGLPNSNQNNYGAAGSRGWTRTSTTSNWTRT